MLKMTNDEAQEWLLAQHNAAPGPPDPARFGAAIRAIRAKAIADAKEWAVEPVDIGLREALELARKGLKVLHAPHFDWGCNSANCTGQEALDRIDELLATGSEATPTDSGAPS